MKIPKPLLLGITAVVLPLSSCIVPVGPYEGPAYGPGLGYYSVLPVGFVGESYWYGGRYYYGGHYYPGRYYHGGHYYSGRYYHGGRYIYGGRYEHHEGHRH